MTFGPLTWQPGMTMDHVKREVVERAYAHFGMNKTRTADSLGIAIRTLDNWLEEFDAQDKAEKQRLADEVQKKEDMSIRMKGIQVDDGKGGTILMTQEQYDEYRNKQAGIVTPQASIEEVARVPVMEEIASTATVAKAEVAKDKVEKKKRGRNAK